MWSVLVVMLRPLPHHPLQVPTAEDENPVQALSATGPDLPLHMRVSLGAAIGVLITLMPSARKTASAGPAYLASWSWITMRTGEPSSCQTRFRAC
jgi:hypothetical protein